jgi:hypothetical protein
LQKAVLRSGINPKFCVAKTEHKESKILSCLTGKKIAEMSKIQRLKT